MDEALTHLRELISNEMADAGGPMFASYGLELEPCRALALRPKPRHMIQMSGSGRQPWQAAAEINNDPTLSQLRLEAIKAAAEAAAARRWNARQAKSRRMRARM